MASSKRKSARIHQEWGWRRKHGWDHSAGKVVGAAWQDCGMCHGFLGWSQDCQDRATVLTARGLGGFSQRNVVVIWRRGGMSKEGPLWNIWGSVGYDSAGAIGSVDVVVSRIQTLPEMSTRFFGRLQQWCPLTCSSYLSKMQFWVRESSFDRLEPGNWT